MVSTNYHIEFSGAKHMDYAMIKKRSRKKKKKRLTMELSLLHLLLIPHPLEKGKNLKAKID